MSALDITLDDRRFQDLVSQARKRVAERCPEWTEHNVSDPGITLIETFAWMTEMLVYRLNRVPEKLHVALLQLLDIELEPPAAAEAALRFRLAAPAERPVAIPARTTEVTTALPLGVVFRTCDEFVVQPVRPEVLVLDRGRALVAVPAPDGTARPTGTDQPAFSTPPAPLDAIHLGFARPLDRLVLRVDVDVTRANGVGIKPKDPPLRWQVWSDDDWVDAEVLEDTTGGFNEGGGVIELQLPSRSSATALAGRHLHWLRCVVTDLTRSGLPSPRYSEPPRIHRITAHAIGALVRAEDAVTEYEEILGESDETPGQTFTLRNVPAIGLSDGETLEVLEPGDDDWVPWERRDSFDASDPDDRHFRFYPAIGEIELGPAIRTRREGWEQHGAIPPKGARLRMSRYRHGGGEHGSVGAGLLTELRNPIPGVASVANPLPASGGVDAETLAVARRRAGLEHRTRYRAVTAEDFAFLAEESSPKVSRAHCLPPAEPHTAVRVYVLPHLHNPERRLSLHELTPSETLLEEVKEYLDQRRLVGTSVHVTPVPLRAVTVVVDVLVERSAFTDTVEREINEELYRFLNPLVGGSLDPDGEGWDFGRAVKEGDLYSLLRDVPGVDHVEDLRLYATELTATGERPEARPSPDGRIGLAPNELICSATHRVRARHADDA